MKMWQLFSAHSKHKKRAKSAAIVWTLLIFIACFIPGNEIPDVRVPFADKWVHFVLFGGFSFLWLMAAPTMRILSILKMGILGSLFGWLVEELQGLLSFLGRAKDLFDIYADALGAFLGAFIFYVLARIAQSKLID